MSKVNIKLVLGWYFWARNPWFLYTVLLYDIAQGFAFVVVQDEWLTRIIILHWFQLVVPATVDAQCFTMHAWECDTAMYWLSLL